MSERSVPALHHEGRAAEGMAPGSWPGATLDRRDLMRMALLLVGASVAGGMGQELQAAPAAARWFDARTFAMLDAVAEIIVPRTDTPGARDVGIPALFDAMMRNWASEATRTSFQAVLDDIDAEANRDHGQGIARLNPMQQLDVVGRYDAAHHGQTGYARFKGLILALYYMSEPGATQELRYEPVPGVWEPSIPVTPDTRAWAVDSF